MTEGAKPSNKRGRGAAPGTKHGPKRRRADVGKDVWGPQSKIKIGPQAAELFIDPESIKDWDDEELLHGKRRDRNGGFTGQPPAIVPIIVYREMVRRQLNGANQEMANNLVKAVERLTQIATAPGYDAKDQLTAIKMIMDRVMGTAPQRIAVAEDQPTAPWAQALVSAIVEVPEDVVPLDDPNIVDAEVIEG